MFISLYIHLVLLLLPIDFCLYSRCNRYSFQRCRAYMPIHQRPEHRNHTHNKLRHFRRKRSQGHSPRATMYGDIEIVRTVRIQVTSESEHMSLITVECLFVSALWCTILVELSILQLLLFVNILTIFTTSMICILLMMTTMELAHVHTYIEHLLFFWC